MTSSLSGFPGGASDEGGSVGFHFVIGRISAPLSRLVAQVKALSSSEKALFTWLIEHDGQQVSSRQLADAVGMDVRVTWTCRTKKLVRLPFIAQWGTHPFWYRARLGEYARRYFASTTDPRVVMQALLQAAS